MSLSPSSNYSLKVLYDGYSRMEKGSMRANCTCTLIKGPNNMIIDTMTAWDRDKIVSGNEWHTPALILCKPQINYLCYRTFLYFFYLSKVLFFIKQDIVVYINYNDGIYYHLIAPFTFTIKFIIKN